MDGGLGGVSTVKRWLLAVVVVGELAFLPLWMVRLFPLNLTEYVQSLLPRHACRTKSSSSSFKVSKRLRVRNLMRDQAWPSGNQIAGL